MKACTPSRPQAFEPSVEAGIEPQAEPGSLTPQEFLVNDEPGPCPYLREQTARLPLRLPLRGLSREELSRHLASGDRRQGLLLYRPQCPSCRACQGLRIPVQEFVPSRTQRRILQRGDRLLRTEVTRPKATAEKVLLYNRHKVERHLLVRGELLDDASYADFLVETCAETIEVNYRCDGELVAVAIADRAADALSAVYCYFDPTFGWLSPGTYSILKHIELCRRWELRYLYLGLYVIGSPPMAYKTTFLPHERLIDRRWQRFGRSG